MGRSQTEGKQLLRASRVFIYQDTGRLCLAACIMRLGVKKRQFSAQFGIPLSDHHGFGSHGYV
jgi:hypothetical protein